ncbi:hypothetical protein HDV03_004028 [Kappamyces sp. JEL0829]|nr:hypothetical protein HDV03_004028 [Kappamyces sp. JEL0829]
MGVGSTLDSFLELLATLSLNDTAGGKEQEAALALEMLQPAPSPSPNPLVKCFKPLRPAVQVDSILKMKAQHLLQTNREKLVTILRYNMSMEEFKQKMNPCPLSKQRMLHYQRKVRALQAISASSVTIRPHRNAASSKVPHLCSPSKRKSSLVLPFPDRQNRRKDCVTVARLAR